MLSVFPPLAPLVLAIKQLLVEHDLNDPYNGGLSSYGILLLVTWCVANVAGVVKVTASTRVCCVRWLQLSAKLL
jgi:hypothetical protein